MDVRGGLLATAAPLHRGELGLLDERSLAGRRVLDSGPGTTRYAGPPASEIVAHQLLRCGQATTEGKISDGVSRESPCSWLHRSLQSGIQRQTVSVITSCIDID
jgi:hypothetical protein